VRLSVPQVWKGPFILHLSVQVEIRLGNEGTDLPDPAFAERGDELRPMRRDLIVMARVLLKRSLNLSTKPCMTILSPSNGLATVLRRLLLDLQAKKGGW